MARSSYIYVILNSHPDILEYTGNPTRIEGTFTVKHELLSFLKTQGIFDYSIQDKYVWDYYQISRIKDGKDVNIEGNSVDITKEIIQELKSEN